MSFEGAELRSVLRIDELPETRHAHEFVGADHGDVPFSLILVTAPPGAGPALHRHPYPEVFIVESGRATFFLDEVAMEVEAGHLVVGPSNVSHGFTNIGGDDLRLIAVHGAARFQTEWLTGVDPQWVVEP